MQATRDPVLKVGEAAPVPGLDLLWAETRGDPGVCIAVLDGPVDLSHPCFQAADIKRLESLVSTIPDDGPATEHGTHVASVIFGQPGGAVQGIAPGCRGLIIPIFASRGQGLAPCSQLDLARALMLAVEHGAHVINISGGQLEPSGEAHPLLADAVRSCARYGVLIVAAAGNDGCECLHIPAALDTVLAVGAMNREGSPLDVSNWGGSYQTHGILAPGENIAGAVPSGGIAPRTGTSFANAIVSGIAGLLLSLQLKRGTGPNPDAVRRALLTSAVGCEPSTSECRRLLAGRLNLSGALTQLTQGGLIEMSEQHDYQEVEAVQSQEVTAASAEARAVLLPAPGLRSAEPPGTGFGVTAAGVTQQAVAERSSPGPAPSESEWVTPSGGSQCGCQSAAQATSLVYALGKIGYDFPTEARFDSFVQLGVSNPNDPQQLLAHLAGNPSNASAVTWILSHETVSIYAIQPGGAFAANAYELLRQFLNGQLTEGVELVSVPGYIAGNATLQNGQRVPIILPVLRGMYSWSTPALCETVLGPCPPKDPDRAQYNQKSQEVSNFLYRIYYEISSLGVAAPERAMNYAATNAFQVGQIYESAIKAGMSLDKISVERSPICRPESDCWDVKLTFFNPTKQFEQARMVYRFTVDVSDVVPVSVGPFRSWYVY